MTPTLRPTLKQHLAWKKWLDSTTRFILFGGGAGGGKSWWICEKRLVRAYQYPGMKAFIGRKELKRLMQSTYVTWTKVCAHHRIPEDDWKLNGQYNYIEFRNGSRIDLLDVDYLPSDPLFERFGSLEYTEGDLEEAGEIRFLAFDVLKSRVGRHMNREFGILPKIGLTANPSKNFLYSVFYKPWKSGTLPEDYAFIQALYQDNPHTAEEYGQQLSLITDKATKERLKFGNWEYDDDPAALIEYDAILDLFTNTVDDRPDLWISGDIARYGHDKTVFYVWKGLKVVAIYAYEKQGIDDTSKELAKIAAFWKVPFSHIIVDEDGVGGGVVDNLRGIKGFVANSTPLPDGKNKKPNYASLKAQCTYKLAELTNARRIRVDTQDTKFREMLIEELEQVKSKDADKDGKLQIQPKDRVKELIGRSPDYSDCLMMRMYFELDYKPHVTVGTTRLDKI